jgi:hypothetical protein
MYKFSEYVLRRDEVNFNPNLGRVLPQSVRGNVDFSLPTAAMKTGAAALQGMGTLAGGMVAALSGVPVTIAAMQDAKTRFERAQRYILPYLAKDKGMRDRVLQKVDSALAFLDSNKDTGVVGGGGLPVVQMGGVHGGVGSALWRGLSTSFRNLYDTLLNRSNKTVPFLKMLDQFKVMFESLGEMSKEVAYGKLRAFKQAAEVGSTYIDPDTMR